MSFSSHVSRRQLSFTFATLARQQGQPRSLFRSLTMHLEQYAWEQERTLSTEESRHTQHSFSRSLLIFLRLTVEGESALDLRWSALVANCSFLSLQPATRQVSRRRSRLKSLKNCCGLKICRCAIGSSVLRL